MNKELETAMELYEQSKSRDWSSRPKQTIFNWRCPKCNTKLKRKFVKVPLYAEVGGNEFASRVVNDHGQPPGLYNLTMEHFTCSCGYEYIGEKLDQVEM